MDTTEVPHVWVTTQHGDGSLSGECLRCNWKIEGSDSDDYKRAQEERSPAKKGCGCHISQRKHHECYSDTRNFDNGWICHHCGVTSEDAKAAKEREDLDNVRCIYPDPSIERTFDVKEQHTWSYSEKPSDCVCTCTCCGYTITAASRTAAVLLTAREDKNVPCVVRVEGEEETKTVKTRKDPEYAEKCQNILEGLVEMQKLMEDETVSLTVMALHEASFWELMKRGISLVDEYSDV